ncbi:N-acylneuraminate-9-phosphatase [Protopterus annectens]|uniref:N-acylneuraminate-9-phosphatase n=1 Tax=Protopterus annectens TaxID=7888 RepID=UPI001CFA3E20|nr:N-acylneuraminate-9-phosphatase [Protopterus annectens]
MGFDGIKAVIFDLDNTLIDTTGAGNKAILQVKSLLRAKFHCPDDHINAICEKFQEKLLTESFRSTALNTDDARILHWDTAIREVTGDETNGPLSTECYFLWKSTRMQYFSFSDDVQNMLTELRKSFKLLLLTNGAPQVQREKVEICCCQTYFDAVVLAGEHTEEKPAPSIFHHCCNILGVEPQVCVMVGDSLDTDILGGLNAGLKATIWINNSGRALTEGSPLPHYTVSSVLEVPQVLKNIKKEGICKN